uniref:RIKEN cDNA 4930412O13 gene n=1 Tax=Cricetulus griseus TaxID=10029 RepID=A0A8C2MHL7_CRIGR
IEKTVVAVRLGRKWRPEWPLLKQLARDNNHQDAFNSILCKLQSRPARCDRQAGDNWEGLIVKGVRSAPIRPR